MSEEIQKLKLIHEFRTQLVLFLDELINQFPVEADLILIRIFIKDQIPMQDVIGRYIRDILPYKQQVDERNDRFFMEHSVLYHSVQQSKVDHFRELWCSDRLDEHDREMIWRWIDVFNTIAENYVQSFGHVRGWENREGDSK